MKSPYANDAEYFGDVSRVSASMLKVFRRSRPLYHAKYVAQERLPERTTARLELGTACHVAILEPDRWDELVAVAPDVDRRTKAGREAHNEFLLEHEGKTVVTADQAATAQAAAKSVRGCTLTRFLLEGDDRRVELPVVWTDSESGLDCKAKPDLWLPGASAVVDLKTTTSSEPDEFAKSIARYGYHLQARHYLNGTGCERYVWITVDVEPPYLVHVYELEAESEESAERLYRGTMSELAACIEADAWELKPTAVQKVRLPEWA